VHRFAPLGYFATVSPRQPLLLVAWGVAILGLLLYILSIAAAVARVGRQYGPTMQGKRGLRIAAITSVAGSRWYFLLIGAVGLAVVLLAR